VAREFPVSIAGCFEIGLFDPPRAPHREVFVVIELFSIVWSRVFRCRHKKCTPLITCRKGQPRSRVAAMTGTYFVCLGCGKEFAYDWDNMRVIDPEPSRVKILADKAAQLYAGK
jgi:hypothetical protein